MRPEDRNGPRLVDGLFKDRSQRESVSNCGVEHQGARRLFHGLAIDPSSRGLWVGYRAGILFDFRGSSTDGV
ncbi:hypothetical protein GWI33_015273 [Rhynchophorus ferrugineus]|uniref:Uncharacterized protein n=1 Tax=Rhynchophorus ferrugineus TaxID=354439 RepID=A0A834HZP7_RHYFE|nr:hypothetical protein GWI33_015273 [Rhynchophorus ferrugineus]